MQSSFYLFIGFSNNTSVYNGNITYVGKGLENLTIYETSNDS